jgi:DNA-binding transcriptional MerR regulator
MKMYNTREASEALGIKQSRFRMWMYRGFVIPAIKSSGRGFSNLFTDGEIRIAREILELQTKGMMLEAAAKIARAD